MNKSALSAFVILSLFYTYAVKADQPKYPSYMELGITVSAIVHPSIGYWWGRKGLRVSGMYYDDDHYEYHLNMGYVLFNTEKAQHSVNLLTSWVVGSDPGADYHYGATGLAYGMNRKGFFFEIGLAIPWKDEIGNLADDPVIPCGYWGYIYQFK